MITAKHRSTFMITKDEAVGPKGDCIIAVKADKSALELDPRLKRAVVSGKPLLMTLRAGELVQRVSAWGHHSLILGHPTDIVVRKSRFICGRTLTIGADKAASDLPMKFVETLRNPLTKFKMEIVVDTSRI